MDILKLEDPLAEFERIYYLEPFEKELDSIFKKSKVEYIEYKKYLIECLSVLDKSPEHIYTEPFELLKVDDYEIYRIKSKSKRKNVRVVYFYNLEDEIVLLCAFQEKNKSDYNNNIKKAKARIDFLLEE